MSIKTRTVLFQQKVYDFVKTIPEGEMVTCKEAIVIRLSAKCIATE